jgi:hypothetical protein
MGKSSSKLGISKGSMNHIGTTPYKYKVSLFVSHIDGINTADEVCVTMERHGKNESTSVVKVKDKKAVFRETLTMETTLFRRQTGPGKVGGSPIESEDIKFDEKIAKIALRKGNAEGKSLGKIHLNLADYIKGPTGTVFADIKLSNDSIIVSRIESELLQMGKKKKNGEDDSEALSDTTERDTGMDNDSIFGDHVEEKDDLDLMISDAKNSQPNLLNAPSKVSLRTTPTNQNNEKPWSASANDDKILAGSRYGEMGGRTMTQTDDKPSEPIQSSLGYGYGMPNSEGSDASSSSLPSSNAQNSSIPFAKGGPHSPNEVTKGGIDESSSKSRKEKVGDEKNSESLASSPSLRNRLKAKLKRDKASKKDPGQIEGKEACASPTAVTQNAFSNAATEIAELRLALDAAQSENKKLKASKQALMTEIDELRSEIEANEESKTAADKREQGISGQKCEGMRNSNGNFDFSKANKDLQDKVYMLENEIEVLRDGQSGTSEIDSSERERASMLKVKAYERKIEDLEVALRREPQYLAVVDELKVTKMALALANMEREQALFALKQYESATSSNTNATNAGWTLF